MEHPAVDSSGAHASPKPVDLSRDSPASQKRVRDYGAELKGLSPLADEESPREQSGPAFKRRKLGYNNGAEGSDSESLDDGEIVESPSDSHAALSVGTALAPGADLESETLNTLGVPIKVSSENNGGITASSVVKEVSDPISEVDEGSDPGESREHENTSSATSYHPQLSLPGWNHGIQLGTRTAFGPRPANSALRTPPPLADGEPQDEEQEQQTKKEKKRARSRDPVFSFEASNATWNFPLSAPDVVAPKKISEEDDFWATLLKSWIVHLVQANGEAADHLTYKVVRSGWPLYFTKKMGFLQGSRKHIVATRLVAQKFMNSLSKDHIETMILDARLKHSANQPDDVSTTGSSLSSHAEELRLQSKYFPGADGPSQHCLLCSGLGHTTQTCPELNCRFCNSGSHNSFGCPTRRRCDKCRQTGHSTDTCQEKLALAPDELGGCVFCSADHQDQDCFEIWTSFKPSESNTKMVKSIPAFCYVCGGENHYGPECSLSDKVGKATGHITWSKATRDLYTDPECEDVAIAWIDVDYSQLTRREFHIPGRATRKNHTYFVSSESEEELIHAPVQKPQPRGEIRFSTNIGTTNGNFRARSSGHKSWQPPLPAGPPPSLAGHEQRRSFQSASSGTLPPRPQAFSHIRQSGRGRGGYRGHGRGRGRGK
ncbi:hypothetical protein F5Y12DRAFT_753775 [Xylaria sp. FL1777]|nr:hypothetical protein F5Y12DRAFT_753775 [Xylaria sp. FL1777]